MSGSRVVEVIAALTAVAVLAPETVAFCLIAGVPPASGLAAAPVCVLVFAVLGRSRQLVVGATAATAVITSAATVEFSSDPRERVALAAGLALITGALLVVTGFLRWGFIARFLAPAAIQGFLFGLAVVIVVRQFAVMVDIETTGDVFQRAWELGTRVREWNVASLVTGLVCVSALLVLERKVARVPASLVVLAVAAAVYALLDLESVGVRHVMDVPAGLPHVELPRLDATHVVDLFAASAGLALIVFALGHGVALTLRDRAEPPLNANREMVALGVANVLAGLVGGAGVTGSPSASSVGHVYGPRGRWFLPLCAVLLLTLAVAFTSVFVLIPEPALAAVVIVAVRPFLAVAPFRAYVARDRRGLAVSCCAVLGVITLTLVPGLLIAVVLSLAIFIADASRLRVSELGCTADGSTFLAVERFPDVVRYPGVTILRPDGQLFFANAGLVAEAVDRSLLTDQAHVVVLDLAASFELSLDVIDSLNAVRQRVELHGGALLLAHLYLGVLDAVQASQLSDLPAFQTLHAAVAAATQRQKLQGQPSRDSA